MSSISAGLIADTNISAIENTTAKQINGSGSGTTNTTSVCADTRIIPSAAEMNGTNIGTGSGMGASRTAGRLGYEPSLGFSEILVTRHLVHHRHSKPGLRVTPRPVGYYYYVCGPHSNGYQRAFAQICSTPPHNFPWNRLDQLVCGWDCDLDLGLKLRCKRFALLDFHEQLEDSLRTLLSAPAGTQRLLSAAMAIGENLKTSASTSATSVSPANTCMSNVSQPQPQLPSPMVSASVSGQEGPPELSREAKAPTLSRGRFDRFVTAVRSRLPIGDRVQWIDATSIRSHWPSEQSMQAEPKTQEGPVAMHGREHCSTAADSQHHGFLEGRSEVTRTHRHLLDMTSGDASGEGGEQLGGRRMFVQLLFDASASDDVCWHLEIRWNMCRGDKVEELIKFCARRAKQAGLLLLQVPTGRRPRPFSPPVLVPVATNLQPKAQFQLRTRLCFVRESSHVGGDLHAGRTRQCPMPISV